MDNFVVWRITHYEEWHTPAMARREYNQMIRGLCEYANDEHADYFKRKVTPETLKRWIARGLCEATEDSIDKAIYNHKIPPVRGRPRGWTKRGKDETSREAGQ